MRRKTRSRSQAGFTLIETIVTVAVLVLVMLGLYGLLDSSNRLAKQETNVSGAQQSSRAAIDQVSKIIRQGRVGQLYFANAILPYYDNAPAGKKITDLSGVDHRIRPGTDVIEVRGILFGDKYALSVADAKCSAGTCTVTIQGTMASGVVNFPAGGAPSFSSKTRPFYFAVGDGALQTVQVGATNFYQVPLVIVGLVDPGSFDQSNPAVFAFTMSTSDPGALRLDAIPGTSPPPVQRPFSGGVIDDVLFFVDEGQADPGSAPPIYTHPSLAQAVFDPSSGNYDVQPLADEIEDFQVAYGVDGAGGAPIDGGVDPTAVDSSAANRDEWVGNFAGETPAVNVVTAPSDSVVAAFMNTAIPSSPTNPPLGAPALRSVKIAIVSKSTDPDLKDKYIGPGALGYQLLDSTALPVSDATITGRPYRRRVQLFAVNLRNYQ